METERRTVGRWAGAALAALTCVPLATRPAAAQQRAPEVEPRECQCVDGQGREIERCVCMITPDGWALGPGAAGLWELPIGPMSVARRAVLGVGISTDQPEELDAQGARVGSVEPESGADEAGLEEGDVIVAVDGRSLLEPLEDADAEAALEEGQSLPVQRFLALLADREPGDEVEVEYVRGPAGERRIATVELGAPRPFFGGRGLGIGRAPFAGAAPRGGVRAPLMTLWNRTADCPTPGAEAVPMLGWGRSCAGGAELIELNAGLAEYFQAEAGEVLVTDVAADNPLGLAAGDVLVAVGGRDVRGLEHALGMLRSYREDEQVQVRVLRKGQTLELDGTLR